MACYLKENTGNCNHTQCPFPDISSFECVEVVGGFCEVGLNCVKQCQFSFTQNKERHANNAFQIKNEFLERKL